MVDNKNQWEDMEYSDEAGAPDNYDDNYSEQDYEAYDEDETVNKKASSSQTGCGCVVILVVLALLIAGFVFFILPKINGGDSEKNTNQQEQTVDFDSNSAEGSEDGAGQSTSELGDMFFNEAGADSNEMMSVDFNESGETNVTSSNGDEEIVATVTETPIEENKQAANTEDDLFGQDDFSSESGQESSEIMVSYNKSSRINPFKPPIVSKSSSDAYELIDNTQFEIIEPPVESIADENLTRLLQTQISGILYDEISPSAIVNLNGIDQFVKIGDSIAGYTIENITKDKVQINYKNNSYVASVGELFTRGVLERQQAVAGLENKFAGRYKNK